MRSEVFFGVMAFFYIMLAPSTKQWAEEAPVAESVDQQELKEAAKTSTRNGYILPMSSDQTLTMDELNGLDKAALSLARNEIYARKGRYFRSDFLTQYFSQFDWYKPYTWTPELTKIEQSNVDLIRKAEAR